jgi:esterase/lipase superfamily enzyme
MGNQMLLNGLAISSSYPKEDREAIKQVVCVAPDTNDQAFGDGILEGLWRGNSVSRVTQYYCDSDWALLVSSWLLLRQERAGAHDVAELLSSAGQQYNSVDCSKAPGSLLAHSYHASSEPVRRDLKEVLYEKSVSDRLGRTIVWLPNRNQDMFRFQIKT